MYKSKLQVLCQQKHWGVPDYSTTKAGLDHNPRFTAIVTVNGVSFATTDQSRTAKEATNKAAKLAFDHFSSPVQVPNQSPNRPQPSSTAVLPNAAVPTSSSGVRHLYKNRLQNYAQKRNLSLPEYSCECEGPPHASRFKSKVTINGITYESPVFFPTIKEAEHAAAKLAWESLSTNEVQEDDCGLYKNLLQEYAQREGFNVPMYDTIVSGPPHLPTFVSTVEIGGKSFQGHAAKSKKQAETSAAKIAYYGLQERCQNKGEESTDRGEPLVMENTGGANLIPPTILPLGCQIKEALEISSSILQSVIAGDLKQSVGPKPSLVIKDDQNEECTDGNGQKFSSKLTTGNTEVGNRHSPDPLPEADINAKRHRCSPLPSPDVVHPSFRDQFPLSSSSSEACVSSPSANLDLNIDPPAGASGTNGSPREKILVYPFRSNMSFPDDATVLPFSDDKWVALKMDSSQQ